MELIANLAAFIFWICLIWLIYAVFKKKDKKKPAIATAVSFAVATILLAVASNPEVKEKRKPSAHPKLTKKKKAETENKQIAKSKIQVESAQEKQRHERPKEYLGDYYQIKRQILALSPQWKEEDAVPIKENGKEYKRKVIKAPTSFATFVGIPNVVKVEFMLVPSDKNWQNMDSLLLLGGITKYVCGEYSKEKNTEFVRKFAKHLANFGDKEITYVGKCKAELGKVDKDFPLAYVTFTPR
jgi:hypothetical protein